MEKNCDPMFYQVLELTIDATINEPLPPFIFDVYDKDSHTLGSDTFDYMGRCLFFMEDASLVVIDEREDANEDFKIPEPKWHDLKYSQDSPPQGKILISIV